MLSTPIVLIVLSALTQTEGQRSPQPVLPHFEDIKTEAPQSPARTPHPADEARPMRRPSDDVPQRILDAADRIAVGHTIDRVWVDRPEGDAPGPQWWVRGRTYKASFGADGVQYIPFFGSSAPRNYPLSLRLASIEVGGEPLELQLSKDAHYDGERMTLERGVTTEVYELGLESIEQKFIFAEPLAGEVRVSVAFESDLLRQEAPEGLRLGNQLGAIVMSGAVAFDAEGASVKLETIVADGAYTIVVPEHFVEAASFPLTIDPVISTFTVDDFGASLSAPKVAYDPGEDVYVTVYQEDFSATDGDVYLSRVEPDGTSTGVGYIDFTGDLCSSPDVGCARNSDRMLVAYARTPDGTTDHQVTGRMYTPSTANIAATTFRIDTAAFGGRKLNVSVGGGTTRFLVVWGREFSTIDNDVHARVVTFSEIPIGTSETLLDNSSADYKWPSCSKHNGSLDINRSAWAIVASRTDAGVDEVDMAIIRWTGAVIQDFTEVFEGSTDSRFPHVSSPLEQAGPLTYMATWERAFASDSDVYGAVIGEAGVGDVRNLTLSGLAGTSIFDDEFSPKVDCNGRRFTLAWRDSGTSRTYASTVILVAGELCVAENSIVDSSGFWDTSGLATEATTFGGGDSFIACQDVGAANIEGAIYNDFARCLGGSYCGAVANSTGTTAEMHAIGSGVAGDSLTLYATRLPLHQFALFLCSRTQGFVPGAGGSQGNLCLGGDIGRFNMQIQNAGPGGNVTATADTSLLPLNFMREVFPGETIRFQCWFRDNDPGSTSNYTDGLVITFD